ncbi:hypothetical protein BBBOND_0308130 [Babesia bigemina]|uniref:Uncharacterized protein n=1 Tax=Babesia bigemina TaxID=5866 RepID=A0A061DCV4_BABBI|nr:hypothetical protein BBBOND_0308130 [Babesia bigemina]CDR96909.1 hypothetical protein BBBOND_0308130 [Babesia bigemina]|eukprot:XP_012769095.1 hypothetical protein BBBOND_0308130 [Babesia bigemina]
MVKSCRSSTRGSAAHLYLGTKQIIGCIFETASKTMSFECKSCDVSQQGGVLIGVACSLLIFAICFNVGIVALETDVFSNMFRKSPSLPSNK